MIWRHSTIAVFAEDQTFYKHWFLFLLEFDVCCLSFMALSRKSSFSKKFL